MPNLDINKAHKFLEDNLNFILISEYSHKDYFGDKKETKFPAGSKVSYLGMPVSPQQSFAFRLRNKTTMVIVLLLNELQSLLSKCKIEEV